jgi:hypothetical protein
MRTPPKQPAPVALEDVLAQVDAAFASHCPATFGVHVKGTRMYWRDSITGEIGHLPGAPLPATIDAVLAKLARLRSQPPCAKASAERKPPQTETERRVEWHTADGRPRKQAQSRR